jgi:hypothetical protein
MYFVKFTWNVVKEYFLVFKLVFLFTYDEFRYSWKIRAFKIDKLSNQITSLLLLRTEQNILFIWKTQVSKY